MHACRWDVDAESIRIGEHAVRFGAFVRNAAMFDAEAFGLFGKEAVLVDPQQRLLLECTAQALQAGGGEGRQPGLPDLRTEEKR